jgi:hypothetical protein
MRSVTGGDPTTVHKMVAGALAGVTAQSITYPLEVRCARCSLCVKYRNSY